MTETILAWHGDPDLKARTVERMRRHRELDDFIGGTYLKYDPEAAASYKGCFHGCLVTEDLAAEVGVTTAEFARLYMEADTLPGRLGEEGLSFWDETERFYGIPYRVGAVLDEIFESFTFGSNAERGAWAVAATEAIPVGADLSGVTEAYNKAVSGNGCECGACRGEHQPKTMLRLLAEAPVLAVKP